MTATGSLSAIVTVQVGSQVSGRVQALLMDFNEQVHKGQIIARLDPELFQAAVAQARAQAKDVRSPGRRPEWIGPGRPIRAAPSRFDRRSVQD